MRHLIRFSTADQIPGLEDADPRDVAEAAQRIGVREGEWFLRACFGYEQARIRAEVDRIVAERGGGVAEGRVAEGSAPSDCLAVAATAAQLRAEASR